MRLLEFDTANPFTVVDGNSITIGSKTFVQHPTDHRDKLVLIDADLLEKLWARSGEDWIIGKGPEYKNQIKNRIAQFKQYYENNNEIRVGNASVRPNGVIGFGDGRHRARVMIELGMKQIPISMDRESILNLEQV